MYHVNELANCPGTDCIDPCDSEHFKPFPLFSNDNHLTVMKLTVELSF